MIQLLIIIIVAASLSIAYQKKLYQLLPVVTMASMLIMYIFALFIRNLTICTFASLSVMILLSAVSVYNKRNTLARDRIPELLFTPQVLVLFIVCVLFFLLFSNRKVFHWDDLSYWGIYAKNLFYLNKLPVEAENCTISYKDYMPLMQLVQEFFICLNSSFNEALLFQINICFLYLLMLPFLDSLDKEKNGIFRSGIIILYIIFPHIFTTQFYYKLGIDYLISILFGYGLYVIRSDDFRTSDFKTTAIITVLSFLALIKSSGFFLCLFLMLFYFFCTLDKDKRIIIKTWNKRNIINIMATVLIPMMFYFSWVKWCKITSNQGYTSEKINSNIKSLNLSFPDYTKSVIIDYIKHVFVHPLTRDSFGITAFIIIVCIIFLYHIQKKSMFKAEARISEYKRMHFFMLSGLFIFCLAHIYMYLFVFDDWEALGLMEYDRYINQYLAGVFYYYACSLWGHNSLYLCHKHIKLNPSFPLLVLFFVFLPYRSIYQYLIPEHYNAYYETEWKPFRDTALQELDSCRLKDLGIPYDKDHRLMLIGNAWLDEVQYFTYELVPQPVAIIANIPALEAGNLSNYVKTLSENYNIKYIYVMTDVSQYYAGDFQTESKTLTLDNNPLKEGKIYAIEKDSDDVLYSIMN